MAKHDIKTRKMWMMARRRRYECDFCRKTDRKHSLATVALLPVGGGKLLPTCDKCLFAIVENIKRELKGESPLG